MDYRIKKRVVKASQPNGSGFSKQQVVWDVVSPDGNVVRSFKNRGWAQDEITRRKGRRTQLQVARDEAEKTGQPVTIKRKGQQPITVSFMPT